MSHRIQYHCKICGRPGVAEADESCPPDQIDVFAKCLCCTICYDGREKRQRAEKAIFRSCHFLIHADELKNPDRIRQRAREIIFETSRRYAEAVCATARVALVFSDEFPEQLIRTPEKAGAALSFYRRSISEFLA